MTDMTAEQHLEYIREQLGAYCENAGHLVPIDCEQSFDSLRQALSAPRVPDGVRHALSEIEDAIAGNAMTAAQCFTRMRYLLTAAQSPAEPYCKDCHSVGMIHCSDPVNCKPADPAQDEIATPERNSYDKVIADQDAEIAKLRTKYEQLREIIDDGSESMTHDDAVGELLGLRDREKVLEANYLELLYQVHEKIDGQTRHETALARLRAHNNQDNPPESASLRQGGDQ